MKRKADAVDWESRPCPLCSIETLPSESKIQWIACEACHKWYHAICLGTTPQSLVVYFCDECTKLGKGLTQTRESRPKRAQTGIDYNALDAGEHVNSLRHSYTGILETRTFAKSLATDLEGTAFTRSYIEREGFSLPVIVHEADGLDMSFPKDLTVDEVARLVGEDTPIEVMDVPTQGEDRGWTLGRWAQYYNEPSPERVRNVISLEFSNTRLASVVKRPRIVRDLDIVNNYWPKRSIVAGQTPKVQAYCLMSLTNSYTDFHVDFAGTSVYYHILQGSKTFLFIPPTLTNLKKYSDWCKSSDQSKTFLADECKDTFKVELSRGNTLFIPSGWIHAVHTPLKSLVIGGNFLHLPGMQKHLEIADIEELTKVPGKFRFPFFNKTLWFTAIGVLARREPLNQFEILGLLKMSEYLFDKALAAREKAGKRSQDDIPLDHIMGSPITLVKLLHDFVRYRAATINITLPPPRADYQVNDAEKLDSCVWVKADVRAEHYMATTSDLECSARTVEVDGESFIECWIKLPLSAQADVAIHSGDPDKSAKYVTTPVQGKDISTETPSNAATIAEKHETQESLDTTAHSNSKDAIGSSDETTSRISNNTYLPPLMTHAPGVHLIPTLRKSPSMTSGPADNHKNSTCFRCKTRKKKCDKERPCNFCREAGLQDSCFETSLQTIKQELPPPSPQMHSDVVSPSAAPVMNVAVVEPPRTFETVVPVSGDIKAPKKQKRAKKLGGRCSRCARDRKQCSREEPMCDRCVKRGLDPSECVYSTTVDEAASTAAAKEQQSHDTVPPESPATLPVARTIVEAPIPHDDIK